MPGISTDGAAVVVHSFSRPRTARPARFRSHVVRGGTPSMIRVMFDPMNRPGHMRMQNRQQDAAPQHAAPQHAAPQHDVRVECGATR
jgi:hypothetical protein